MQFNKNRILLIFFGYAIMILIPLSILVFQGVSSLNREKRQRENNVLSRLQRISDNFRSDFEQVWRDFLENEKRRKFYHYPSLVIPDEHHYQVQGGGASVRRSPLYKKVANLARLNLSRQPVHEPGARTPPSVIEILENSLIGYFHFDPQKKELSSPYLDRSATFETPTAEADTIEVYHRFLEDQLLPFFNDRWGLSKRPVVKPSNILPHDHPALLRTEDEPIKNIFSFNKLYGDLIDIPDNNANVRVSYYDFSFALLRQGKEPILVCFRPVVLEKKKIIIQGFMFNRLLMIQEAQAHLEPYQPEYGSVAIRYASGLDHALLFPTSNLLTAHISKGDPEKYLQSYQAEKGRFWSIIVLLLIAMTASLVHMGSLIYSKIQLDRKKTNFISAITHELKAPLTSIIMYAEMLEEGWAKGKESTYYRHIHGESERLTRLIKNILDFSGLERGVFKLKKNSLLLHTFVEETLEPLRVWVENNDLQLQVKMESMPYVIADKDSLSQVIYNLIDNTIKYGRSEDKPSVLTIIVDESRTHASLIVYDNGPGVSKNDSNKVFRRFFRCENEMTRESTGTGLGLALVKELVEGNGGTITIYTPPETGFGVKILIPKAVIEPSLESRPTS